MNKQALFGINPIFGKPQGKPLFKSEGRSVVMITIGKDEILPEHISTVQTFLVVLKGRIDFFMNGEHTEISADECIEFPADVKHSVKGIENSVFLLYK